MVRQFEHVHPLLPPMRRASRTGRLYVGPCPFCADGGEDRFHVWMEASNGRPAERYWCRVCNRHGLLRYLDHTEQAASDLTTLRSASPTAFKPQRPPPHPDHIPFYQELYEAVALWAHAWLLDLCHPDARTYLLRRGLSDATIRRAVLGVTLNDAESLVSYLRETCPDAVPYAEEAGLVVADAQGRLVTHWHLRGRIVFPYIADGKVVDLRTRTYGNGKGYRSLGPYRERGADFPFAWDEVQPGTRTVIIAEAEFKALAALQAFHAGELDAPTLGQPGLTVFRASWAHELVRKGVSEVVLCYDSQPRPLRDGLPSLTPEEQWSLRHGATCAAAGLQARIARLPLAPGATKAEIDTFIPQVGAAAFQQLIATAPLLDDYHRSIERGLLEQHNLPVPAAYPLRRGRPTRLAIAEAAAVPQSEAPDSSTLAETRTQIAACVAEHAATGQGFLVLAHPPGAGKGFNTANGLRAWKEAVSPADDRNAPLVWTAQRKEQIHDQPALELIPLTGRSPSNCHKLAEARVLAQKGYAVKEALCLRRCPFVDRCTYLRQFGQTGDFFASSALLHATGWWTDAGVVVLDEFDPTSLLRRVPLSIADLAAMSRANARAPAIQTALRWVAQAVATTTDRVIGGALWYAELVQQSSGDTAAVGHMLARALAELPSEEEQNLLIGLPNGATLADYQALPPGYTATLLRLMAHEFQRWRSGHMFTSRIEAQGGRLELFLRIEHLITQLARPEQPKILLDATLNADLLRALFPTTPLRIEQPHLPGALRVIQVVGNDWAKRSLSYGSAEQVARRCARWYDAIGDQIRPGRPTLVVCTRDWAEQVRNALASRGHRDVVVAHYGALRGSNAYHGYDVLLAQVYHPNLDALVRDGRALFADDPTPLDERMIIQERILRDATGAAWRVETPMFRDSRLAALLEQRREAELLQCALRGRPFDQPEVQITLLFSLPIPGLLPTLIVATPPGPASNGGREQACKAALCAAAQHLLDTGIRVLDAAMLAAAAQTSVVTVRRHWRHVAARLHLTMVTRRRSVAMPRGGVRHYLRKVLVRRGRRVPEQPAPPCAERPVTASDQVPTIDQAHRRSFITRVIHRSKPRLRFRCSRRHRLPNTQARPPPA
jgi:hypothetical protein